MRALLSSQGIAAELLVISTSGDKGVPRTAEFPGKGLFTREIEDALLDRRVDLAVHSLKDLAAVQPKGLDISAYPERADPRDVLVSQRGLALAELPPRARVGTSSIRRKAALLTARSDLLVVPLRGNVPTRLKRLEEGRAEAVVLAAAGLERLGMTVPRIYLDPAVFVPAPGQGALAVQCRSDDQEMREKALLLDNADVRRAVEAERAALKGLEGGCHAPIGAVALDNGGSLLLHVAVYDPTGSGSLMAQVPVDPADPGASGRAAAEQLLARGAGAIIRQGGTA